MSTWHVWCSILGAFKKLKFLLSPKISRPKNWKLDQMISRISPHYGPSFSFWYSQKKSYSKNANMTYLKMHLGSPTSFDHIS